MTSLMPSFGPQHHYCKCQRAGGSEMRWGDREKRRERVRSGDMTCLALRNWSKKRVGQRVGERDGGDGERPAMSSLTVHWAAHVSTLHPSLDSGSRTRRHTGKLLMAFYIHHFPAIHASLHTLMHKSYLYSRSFGYCYYFDRQWSVYRVLEHV